jgi:hypothetical protein
MGLFDFLKPRKDPLRELFRNCARSTSAVDSTLPRESHCGEQTGLYMPVAI